MCCGVDARDCSSGAETGGGVRRTPVAQLGEIDYPQLAPGLAPVGHEGCQVAGKCLRGRVLHDQGNGLNADLGRPRQGESLHERAGEIVEHLVVEEPLGRGEVPRDPQEVAQLIVAALPRLPLRQAVSQAFVTKIVLIEGEDGMQLGVPLAHQLAEEDSAAAAWTVVADGRLQVIEFVLDGATNSGFDGRVGGKADRVAGPVKSVAREHDHGTEPEQAEQVVTDRSMLLDRADLAEHRGDVAVVMSLAREAHRLSVVVPGGGCVAQ